MNFYMGTMSNFILKKKARRNKMAQIIDDFEYFRAVEVQVRNSMKAFETELLPVANQAVKDASLQVRDHPKEGYYHETPELGAFFDRLRTLQDDKNYTPVITPAIQKLHDIYTNPIFGRKARRTAIDPTSGRPELKPVIISEVTDPISEASHQIAPNWTIDGIMEAVQDIKIGKSLVGLGILVDSKKIDRQYNPLATCMSCETTGLSREKIYYLGPADPIDWRVRAEVERYGDEVLAGYEALISAHSTQPVNILSVTPENIEDLITEGPVNRICVNLNVNELVPKGFYHWAMDVTMRGGNNVFDFWSDRTITTQEYRNKWRELSPLENHKK